MYQSKANKLTVDAFEWDGKDNTNSFPEWAKALAKKGDLAFHRPLLHPHRIQLKLRRPDGVLSANPHEFIIRYQSGNLFHMDQKLFGLCFQAQ